MNKGHWQEIHRVWSHYTPPVRPNHEVVAEMRRQIGGASGRVLLLGVTPELAGIAPDLVAIDWNRAMVANLWPGNTNSRRVLVGNWLNSNFVAACFAACVGDGSLNAVAYPEETAMLCREVARVLRGGGRLVVRTFAAPEYGETVAAVRDAALDGAIKNFHAFKWRLAMAIAAQRSQPNLVMGTVFDAFSELFPDRDRLVAATGWKREEIDTIDILQGSVAISSFPTRARLRSIVAQEFADVRFVPVGSYEGAEHCPLLVAEKSAGS
jgi:SAM-dependent methyltransferase